MGKHRRRRHRRAQIGSGAKALIAVGLVALIVAVGALVASAFASQPERPTSSRTANPMPMPTNPEYEYLTIVGDSYVNGSDQNTSRDTLWHQVLDLPYTYVNILAKGGVGYVFERDGENLATLAAQIKPTEGKIVFFGGRNDRSGYDSVYRAALKVFKAAREGSPNAKEIIVVGPVWPQATPAPGPMIETRDALRDAAAEIDATFVDPIEDRWFVDTPELIGKDDTHPTDEGGKHLADLMRPYLQD